MTQRSITRTTTDARDQRQRLLVRGLSLIALVLGVVPTYGADTSRVEPYYLLFAGAEGTFVESKMENSHAVADYIFAAPLGNTSDSTRVTTGNRLNYWKGWWLTTEVTSGPLPDLTANEPGKSPESAAIDKPKSVPTVAVGLRRIIRNLSDATHLEGFACFGTIIGDPPRANPSGSDRLLWQAGLKFETNYGLAAKDSGPAKDVIGSATLSFKQLNYMRSWIPAGGASRSDDARFVADFRLSAAAISSNSTSPFVYLVIDRSLGRSHGLNFDRVGIGASVDLAKAFAGLGKP